MLVSVNAANTGLSPLARGTHYAFLRLPGFCRFIPAGAGNTRVGKSRGNRTPVYPRWRGEHTYDQACAALALGLSPLARGTPNHAPLFTASARFIPAGAGNTYILKRLLNHKTVYPRWRGEHSQRCRSASIQGCLSPLARGTQQENKTPTSVTRFIPAGAGNTRFVERQPAGATVYPRWRGEHSKHNLLLINDFLSQSQSTNFIVSHKQHIHYVKEHLIH